MSKSFAVSVDQGIAVVTIDRPPVNALTMRGYIELKEIFETLSDDTNVRCIVLAANGQSAFCAGLDLKEFMSIETAQDEDACTTAAHNSFLAIERCAVPVIAAVNGPALGAGCVLTALCDIRIAAPRATFGLPEINVGRCGGSAALSHALPSGLLRQMAFTGEPIDCQSALSCGYVQSVIQEDQLKPTALELARKIASKRAVALRMTKRTVSESGTISLAEAFRREAEYNSELFRIEGVSGAAHIFSKKIGRN